MNLTARERANLQTFDALDFEVFPNQDWARLGESHAPASGCIFPDGHYTDGTGRHVADMAAWFAWAPACGSTPTRCGWPRTASPRSTAY